MNPIWKANAPANIALIKYMGKKTAETNVPTNPSLSYTLKNCQTFLELELNEKATKDSWEALSGKNFFPMELSITGQDRFLAHLKNLKNHFDYNGNFIIRSANNFPADCGLASSASSFAALTIAACEALTNLTNIEPLTIEDMANLSRQGSGSSCRSFFEPWCVWDQQHISPISIPYTNLMHMVIVIDKTKKSVSSSKAHQYINTSLLNSQRSERAQQRMQMLLNALERQNWSEAFQICWQEFWDMHALFETSSPCFGYFTANSLSVLNDLREFWQVYNDGPIVTMDAGPNVHCLFRSDQKDFFEKINDHFSEQFLIIKSNHYD